MKLRVVRRERCHTVWEHAGHHQPIENRIPLLIRQQAVIRWQAVIRQAQREHLVGPIAIIRCPVGHQAIVERVLLGVPERGAERRGNPLGDLAPPVRPVVGAVVSPVAARECDRRDLGQSRSRKKSLPPQHLNLDRTVAPRRPRAVLPHGVHPGLGVTMPDEQVISDPVEQRPDDGPLDRRQDLRCKLDVARVEDVLQRLPNEPPRSVGRVVVDLAWHRQVRDASVCPVALVGVLKTGARSQYVARDVELAAAETGAGKRDERVPSPVVGKPVQPCEDAHAHLIHDERVDRGRRPPESVGKIRVRARDGDAVQQVADPAHLRIVEQQLVPDPAKRERLRLRHRVADGNRDRHGRGEALLSFELKRKTTGNERRRRCHRPPG